MIQCRGGRGGVRRLGLLVGPFDGSRFNVVAYLQQIWWFEVDGVVKFPFPADIYTLSFRIHLGRFSKRLGQRVCYFEHTHGWEIKPPRVSEGRRRRLSHALPPPLILPHADDLSTPSISLLLPLPFTKILICVAEPPDLSICVPLVCSPSFSSSDPLLPQDLCQSAADLSSHSSVPYKPLLRLLSGSDFIFTCPKPREKSEELKARLWKLEELAERKKYEELVKDITQSKGTDEPFSSYKDQLGFAISSALFDYGQELWCQISMVGLIYRSCFNFRLDLQENNLTGQISDEIGNCVSLILLLGLSTNLLHGGIPFSISKLKQLELLNLNTYLCHCLMHWVCTLIGLMGVPILTFAIVLCIGFVLLVEIKDEQFESDEAQVVVVKEIAALEPQAQVVKEIAALEPQARKKLRHLNPKPVHDLAFLYVQRRENGAHVH
ncbi:hypothetical protein RHGRI_007105 [Rhododendron griersonianum]|uniref:Uncharacterized protein n=1 Tax=Rhododendron griersonianum TaxID=479676 RepID=A0AAV6KYL2_9ERIC|nr:hypothetical protein RHGRI_007105 [Rhododendron griersonianum]